VPGGINEEQHRADPVPRFLVSDYIGVSLTQPFSPALRSQF
jgi:hypothetical protein